MTDQKQSGFSNFVNSKILPPIMKFVNTKAIVALQNGMIYTLPFIIVGSIFLILSNIPIPAVANAINASGWGQFSIKLTPQLLTLWHFGAQLVLLIFMSKMKAMNHQLVGLLHVLPS